MFAVSIVNTAFQCLIVVRRIVPKDRLPFLVHSVHVAGVNTRSVHVLRSPNFFFSGMEADRNVKVVGGDVAVL